MLCRNENIGLLKAKLDAHTMGTHSVAALLMECGYKVIVAPDYIEDAVEKIDFENKAEEIVEWLKENRIRHVGVSYRLDENDALNILWRLFRALENADLLNQHNEYYVKSLYFSGVKLISDKVEKVFHGRFVTFCGGESAEETLYRLGVPDEDIPRHVVEGCRYDKERSEFGRELISKGEYTENKPLKRRWYQELGTVRDTLVSRLDYNFEEGFQPLIRAHAGPYLAGLPREQNVLQYLEWCRKLAGAGYLDILSIGASQLSQSNFGEDWTGKANGGGVPVNSEDEYAEIWQAARPMLVRTYSGTKNIISLASIYEHRINMAWHALSLWWFSELDGRGSNALYDNIKEHINVMKYIASIGKPVEANVSHHFAFRGGDDITYIISAYLAARMAKKCGVKVFILQNMLNTPRATWGVQDLAKSRALLKVLKTLEDGQFRIIFQTRTGLDYLKPDLCEAKVQLAAATALMDDIDPDNQCSPEIIHVVSYSEALFLANPEVINESIRITRQALKDYRLLKQRGMKLMAQNDDIHEREERLVNSSVRIIRTMEEVIPHLYSAEGIYTIFVSGGLPTPELWNNSDEFRYARNWKTKMHNGGVWLCDEHGLLSDSARIDKMIHNISEAEYMIKCNRSKYDG